MVQIYKIYMNESQLILADFVPEKHNNIQTIGLQEIDIEKLFSHSQEHPEDSTRYLYIHPDVENVFHSICKKTQIIRAAGGLVKNGNGEYLFIHRLGKWDLPKGKVEEGEEMSEAAQREVEEECGLAVDYLGKKLITTYHTYMLRGKLILKLTEWYEMGVNGTPALVPQLEEDITEAKWIAKEDFTPLLENTYPLIADILREI